MVEFGEKTIKVAETKTVQETARESPHSILIYGGSKVGKTFAYCSLIEEEIKADKDKKFYVLSTDNGFFPSFNYYFGSKDKAPYSNVVVYDAHDARKMLNALEEAEKKVRKKDWIIIDLISDQWEFAQDAYMDMSNMGDKIIDYIFNASKDKKSFGLFEGAKWQYIKRIDHAVSRNLLQKALCNVLGVAAEKDVKAEEAIGGKKEENAPYREFGSRPAGQKTLQYKFNMIFFLDFLPEVNKRFFALIGGRGVESKKIGERVEYERNWFKKIEVK
jgi:DNA helicase HerA-like ATPase